MQCLHGYYMQGNDWLFNLTLCCLSLALVGKQYYSFIPCIQFPFNLNNYSIYSLLRPILINNALSLDTKVVFIIKNGSCLFYKLNETWATGKLKHVETNMYTFRSKQFSKSIQICFRTLCGGHCTSNLFGVWFCGYF